MARRGQFRDDPYYQIWDTVSRQDPNRDTRIVGYLEHREIAEQIERELDLDPRERRQFWADYNLYLVSRRTNYKRADENNPFWQRWNMDPSTFNWRAWREAMGYPHGGRR